MRPSPFLPLAHALLVAMALTGCGDRDGDKTDTASDTAESALPTPGGNTGVTGSADLATGNDGTAPVLGNGPPPRPPQPPADPFFSGLPPEAVVNPETGLGVDPDGDGPLTAPPVQDTGAAEPTPADAVAVIRDYYAALNGRDYPSAYRLWENGGAASGQTPEQFAAGFARAQGISVVIGAPGRVDAAAGNRFIEVPVSLSMTEAGGAVRRFAGQYVLQRSVVDGASPEQRRWRIRNAGLNEIAP